MKKQLLDKYNFFQKKKRRIFRRNIQPLLLLLLFQSSEISTAYLKAFDWKVHLSISSDRAAALNEPLALLQLRVARDSPLVSDDVIIELTRDDLATLIDSLTAANGALAELST